MYFTYDPRIRDKSRPLRQVFRALNLERMMDLVENKKGRGWTPVSDVIEFSEPNDMYRYKIVMEFRRGNSGKKTS